MTTAVARRRNAAGLGKISTTSARRLISLLSRSIIRPSVVGQPGVWVWVSAVKSLEVVGEGVRDALVAGCFVGPAAGVGVGFQGLDVGKLVGDRVAEFGGGDKVVAGFADVGIRAGAGGWVAGAVAVRDTGFQHLAVEPAHLVGQDGLTDWGEGELTAHLAHRFVVGGAQSG